VDLVGIVAVGDRDARVAKAHDVRDAFVAQWVVARGDDGRGRKPREIGGARRRAEGTAVVA
jgi:hypothetical protein